MIKGKNPPGRMTELLLPADSPDRGACPNRKVRFEGSHFMWAWLGQKERKLHDTRSICIMINGIWWLVYNVDTTDDHTNFRSI